MARRRNGQEDLVRPEPNARSSLTEFADLLDWAEIDRHLADIQQRGRVPCWPPL